MKRYKVRHYRSRIYNPIRGKIIKGVIAAVVAVAVFAIGWFAYEPIMQAVNDRNKEIIEETPVPEKPPEPVYEPLPVEFLEKETYAVVVPEEYLYDSYEYYGFIKDLGEEVTAVIIDMKTQSGTVTYASKQVSVNNAGAVHEQAMDLDLCIKTTRSLGLDVVARIYAFQDSTAPYNASDMAIRYESEDGVLWLDDSIDNGGKPWLNPYSDTAQKYILDIVYDAIDSGVDAVLLEGMRFPDEEGMDYAYFGVNAKEVSKADVLKNFSQRIYSTAVVTDTDIIIGFESLEVVTGSGVYGTSPFELSADGYAPSIDLDDFVGQKFGDDFYFRRAPEDLTEVLVKVYEKLGDVSGYKVLPVFDFEGLMKGDTAGIFDFLKENGMTSHAVVYNESYFTGVPEEPVEEPEETPVTPNVPYQPQVPETTTPEQQPQEPSSESSSSEVEEEKEVSVSISGRDY